MNKFRENRSFLSFSIRQYVTHRRWWFDDFFKCFTNRTRPGNGFRDFLTLIVGHLLVPNQSLYRKNKGAAKYFTISKKLKFCAEWIVLISAIYQCLNPLTPLLFLKNLNILNKFKFCFVSNENRALPRMIQNVVLWPQSKAFLCSLSKKINVNLDENQVERSYGTPTRTHCLDLIRTRFRVLREPGPAILTIIIWIL